MRLTEVGCKPHMRAPVESFQQVHLHLYSQGWWADQANKDEKKLFSSFGTRTFWTSSAASSYRNRSRFWPRKIWGKQVVAYDGVSPQELAYFPNMWSYLRNLIADKNDHYIPTAHQFQWAWVWKSWVLGNKIRQKPFSASSDKRSAIGAQSNGEIQCHGGRVADCDLEIVLCSLKIEPPTLEINTAR